MTTALDVQGRRTILYVTNKTGSAVALGDVVVGDASNDEAFTSTTSAGYIGSWVGVVIEANGIANNTAGRVCVQGYVSTITCNASVTRGNFIKTHTVAKQGTSAGSSRVTGVFAMALTTSATPSAVLFGMPDGSTGSAGSPGAPALTLGTTNSTGSAVTLVATDATIAAFDATVPVVLTPDDVAAAGSAGVAARRDHKHGFSVDNLLPWHIVIIPMVWTPDTNTGVWALNAFGDANIQYPLYQPGSTANSGGANSWISAGAQNDANAWYVVLAKGTWDANFWVRKASNTGIITLNMDAVSQGTVDTYAAAVAAAKVSITGFTVASTGKKLMQLLMATKNASSSGYFAELFAIEFRRTA